MMNLSNAAIRNFLAATPPFKTLSPAELGQVATSVREKSFSKGDTIFNEGEPADSTWVVYSGRVQALKYTSQGHPLALESLHPGKVFDILNRMDSKIRNYTFTAVATYPSVTLRIPDRIFLDCCNRSPRMLQGVCALCSDRLKDMQDLSLLGQESVAVRVASVLAKLYAVHGETLPFTKKEISQLAGTTIETTFRTLAHLETEGYIASHGRIRIRKPEELRDYDGC